MGERDLYRLLGISPGASIEEVRAAFRRKVRQRHPDTASDDGDDTDVKEVIEAYRTLMGRESRARHEAKRDRSPSSAGGRRVHVRRGNTTGHVSQEQADLRCESCRGAGVERSDTVCPECDGRAEVTALDRAGARIVRCRRCGGRGLLRVSRTCRVCGGSGAIGS